MDLTPTYRLDRNGLSKSEEALQLNEFFDATPTGSWQTTCNPRLAVSDDFRSLRPASLEFGCFLSLGFSTVLDVFSGFDISVSLPRTMQNEIFLAKSTLEFF